MKSLKRVLKRVLPFVIVLALTGCLLSDDKVFPLDGGVKIPLKLGALVCAPFGEGRERDTGGSLDFTIELKQQGKKYQYILIDGNPFETMVLSFHRVRGNTYIAASSQEGNKSGERIDIINVTNSSLEFPEYRDEEVESFARKHHVEFSSQGSSISGKLNDQKAFLRDLASNGKTRNSLICVPRP